MTCEGTWEPHPGAAGIIEAVQQWRRNIGDVTLKRVDGSIGMLKMSDPGLYVLFLDADCQQGTCRINDGPEWFWEALSELRDKGIVKGIKHIYIGDHADNYQTMIGGLPKEDNFEYYSSTEPELGLTVMDMNSQMLIYKAGILWSMPIAEGIPNASLWVDDQKWLLHRIMTEEIRRIGPLVGF